MSPSATLAMFPELSVHIWLETAFPEWTEISSIFTVYGTVHPRESCTKNLVCQLRSNTHPFFGKSLGLRSAQLQCGLGGVCGGNTKVYGEMW